MMPVINSTAEWRKLRGSPSYSGSSIGFVPTMGALHAGHRALLERARAENDRVVLSVFVNPTQFDQPDDLARYPRTLAADLSLAEGLADAVFAPTPGEMYPDNYQYRLVETELSGKLEGAQRPGHFVGMLTVVLKLLNLIQPRRAYFGEKDWQQLELVRGMVAALFLPVEIVPCPIVRDADGLALSSRNSRLSAAGRARALAFPQSLRTAASAEAAEQALTKAGVTVDYVVDHAGIRLGAVRVEGVRLIDNVRL